MNGVVAVTGASGFIGQHLTAALAAAGIRQRLLVRRLPTLPPVEAAASIELVVGDLTDTAALQRLVHGACAVIHLAGAIKASSRAEFFRANAQGLRDLLSALAATGTPARLVHASSMAAREPHLSDYAASKRASEDHLIATPPAAGWVAIRAPAVYGPGDRETLSFFRLVKHGLALVPAGGRGRLSLIHVADLCAALMAMLIRPPADGVYEIDDGAVGGYSLAEMAGVAAAVLGRPARVVGVPRLVMMGVAGVQQVVARVTGRPAILSPGKVREIFHHDWIVTDRRLAAALDFRPRFDLKDGFADTIQWYSRRKWL